MTKILIKRGTATQWTNSTTPLMSGELGLDTTNNIIKVGNGTTLWNSLSGLTLTSTQVSELAQDAIKSAIDAGTHTNMSVVFDDEANTLSISTGPDVVTSSSLGNSLDGYVPIGDVGNIDGVAPLDENALIPDEYIPSTITRDSEVAELAQDAVGNSVGNGLDYNDETGSISVDPSEFALNTVGSPTTDVNMASHKIINLATPTSSSDAATKAYVDNTTAGLNFHIAAHCATNEDLVATYNNGTAGVGATLTNAGPNKLLAVDNHDLETGERVLVKDQTDQKQNGIYVVTVPGDLETPWVLTRATDADNSPTGEVAYGDFIFIQQGTFGGIGYILTTTGTITLGTSNLVYTEFNVGQTVIAGNGLSESIPGTLVIDTSITVDKNTAQTLTNKTLTSPVINSPTGITKSDVGLGNVDNTSDANKPISTATQTALNAKLDSSGFTYASITIPVYSAIGDLPSAADNHGRWAHVHGEGAMYFAHGGAWYKALSETNLYVSTNSQGGSYTLATSDLDKMVEMLGGGTLTITDSSSFPVGFTCNVLQTGSSQVTIAGSGFTPNATPGLKLRAQWSSATLVKRALNSWVVMGDLSA